MIIAIIMASIILIIMIVGISLTVSLIGEEKQFSSGLNNTVIEPAVDLIVEPTQQQLLENLSIWGAVGLVVMVTFVHVLIMFDFSLPQKQMQKAYILGQRGETFNSNDYKHKTQRKLNKLRIRYLEGVATSATRFTNPASEAADNLMTSSGFYKNNDMEAIEIYLKTAHSTAS